MKNIFAFVLVFLFIVSCDTKNEPILEEETFSFVRIGYSFREDSRDTLFFETPTITFINNTDTMQHLSFDALQGFGRMSSLFESDDPEAFSVEGIKVFAPAMLGYFSNTIFMGNIEWEYNNIRQYYQTDLAIHEQDFRPNTKLTSSARLLLVQYRLNYRLVLRSSKTGGDKIIYGIWTGTRVDGVSMSFHLSALNDNTAQPQIQHFEFDLSSDDLQEKRIIFTKND